MTGNPDVKQGKSGKRHARIKGPRARTGPKKTKPESTGHRTGPPGLTARRLALNVLHKVLGEGALLDSAVRDEFQSPLGKDLEGRDKALARLIAVTVLRRHGELAEAVGRHLEKPLPKQRVKVWLILLLGAAQLKLLDVKPHAAISLSVDLCRLDPATRGFDRLVNAVLRRVSEHKASQTSSRDTVMRNVPAWLWHQLTKAYGEDQAIAIAEASLAEPALDLSVKAGSEVWAQRLGGAAISTATVRLEDAQRIEALEGYAQGEWWVQDVAAALPVRLLGIVTGLSVADVCAAPGGKTLQLAAAGANVTAIDISTSRLKRVRENLTRTGLSATIVAADALSWKPDLPFDAVLLDAPCSATGTIRRHPDILHHNKDQALTALIELQAELLKQVADWVKPGGTLVYCTCSLLPSEGEDQIAKFLQTAKEYAREPLNPGDCDLRPDWVTKDGDLRTLPHFSAGQPQLSQLPLLSGMDGFYAARLRRLS